MASSVNAKGYSHKSGHIYQDVDETGTPISKTGASSSQHSYLWQSNNPQQLLYRLVGEQISGDPYDPNSLKNQILKDAQHGNSGGSGGAGGAGASGSPFSVRDGMVQFSDPNMQAAMMMMQQQAAANNAWSAQQAQNQMDFQERMSSTAHQREVADLKSAGLNPVLSAGGSGAQAMSGAAGETDTSATQGVIQLALGALDAIGSTAVGVAGATRSGTKGGFWNNYYVKRGLGAAAAMLGARGLGKILFG